MTPDKILDGLQTVAECEDSWGSLVTNRYFSMRRVRPLIEAGYVKSIGIVEMVNGDINEGTEKEGFVLTDAGRAYLEAHE